MQYSKYIVVLLYVVIYLIYVYLIIVESPLSLQYSL